MNRLAHAAVFLVTLAVPGTPYAQEATETAVEGYSAVPHQLLLRPATVKDLAEMQYYLIRKEMIPQEAEVARLQANLKPEHPILRDAIRKLERLQSELDTILTAAREVGVAIGEAQTPPPGARPK